MTAGLVVHRRTAPPAPVRCKGCDGPITWAIRYGKGDKRIPLDVPTIDPRVKGAFVVVFSRNGVAWAYRFAELAEKVARKKQCSLARAEEIVDVDYDAHLIHFASCAKSSTFRRGGRR